MGTISELLRYKKEVKLTNPQTGKILANVWIKVLGDEDIKDAYRYSRKVSAAYRAKLRDENSLEYDLEIKSLEEQDDKDLYDLVVAGKVNEFTRESVAVVAREELPSLDEVAVEPDAPALEEQEKLDKAEDAVDQRFTDAINKYVNERKETFEAELKKFKREKVIELAKEQITILASNRAFIEELNDQKGYRATFTDKECKTKAFSSIEDFKNSNSVIKEQILQEYLTLEMDPDEIKK